MTVDRMLAALDRAFEARLARLFEILSDPANDAAGHDEHFALGLKIALRAHAAATCIILKLDSNGRP